MLMALFFAAYVPWFARFFSPLMRPGLIAAVRFARRTSRRRLRHAIGIKHMDHESTIFLLDVHTPRWDAHFTRSDWQYYVSADERRVWHALPDEQKWAIAQNANRIAWELVMHGAA